MIGDSIKNASATLAYNLMSWYQNNQSDTAATAIGTLPAPLYWWEAGAVWGGMVDYWAYTNDTSYNPTISQALLAQVGPDNNYMMPAYYASLGNDDQSFWGVAVLSAAEYGFPNPPSSQPQWIDLAEAVFNTMVPRWNTASCGGGLKWQIFSSNAGYDYKNSISNGGFFQIAARLARYTGNQTYVDWAEKIWDWTSAIGLIDADYNIYDGTSDTINCTQIDHDEWTYNTGMFIYGASIMYNYTNGSSLWENRTSGLLTAGARNFFSPYKNATNVMYERACEEAGTCDDDQYSFKAYLSRWLAKTAVVAPYTAVEIKTLLTASAEAAARNCGGGVNGTTCGERWYTPSYDGVYGVGQELSALEVVQALLLLHGNANATALAPMTAKDVHIAVEVPSSTFSIPTQTATPGPAGESTKSADANDASRARDGVYGLMGAALVCCIAMVFGGSLVR